MHAETLQALSDVPPGTTLTKTTEPCPSLDGCQEQLWGSNPDHRGRTLHVCLACGAVLVRGAKLKKIPGMHTWSQKSRG